jgi:hypothetical protein
MIDRYVVSKAWMMRIPCDGPLTAQVQRSKLENEMKAAGKQPDVEIEFAKEPPKRARADAGRKRSTKLRSK